MTRYEVITGLIDEMVDPTLPKADNQSGPLYWLNAWLSSGLAIEPDPEDPTERGPVTRWIGYAFGNPRMTKTEALAILPIQPGDPNPFFQVIDSIKREGANVVVGPTPASMAYAEPVIRDTWKTPQYAAALVLTGGDAIDLPVYFEFDDPDADCPLQPGTTWRNWKQGEANDQPNQYGEKWYRSNDDYARLTFSGKPINASAWVPAYMAGQLTVLSGAEMAAIRKANETLPN